MSRSLELRRRSLFTGAAALVAAPAIIGPRAAAAASRDVTIALAANILGLDPADLNDNLSMSCTRTMLQGLYGFDKDMKMIPVLAESYEATEDAKEFTFHLRKGISFSDGAPFNAAAVKTSFDRARDPANHLKRASLYAPIDHIEAVDDNTVKIVLKAPFGAFINNTAHAAYEIMSPKAIKDYGKEVDRHPSGTGPFMFQSFTADTLKVVKNPNYWKPGLPKIDSITIRSVPESGSRMAMLQTGEAHFIYPLPVELAKALENSPTVEVITAQSIFVRYVALNNLRKPFDDVRVRQALNYAVDKTAMARVVYNGYAIPLDSALPKGLGGYVSQGTPWPFDLAKAKALLAEAGLPNGFKSTLWGGNDSLTQKAMQFLQQQFAQVGVQVEVEPLEAGVAAAKIWSVQDPKDATTLMHYVGWSSSTGDADWGLRPLLGGADAFPPSLFNTAYYNSPAVNADIAAGLSTADPAKRAAAYKDAQAQIWKDAPWVFMVSDINLSGKTKNLSGIYVMPDTQILTEEAELH
jgi:glutathione transport system substrate-binding protein